MIDDFLWQSFLSLLVIIDPFAIAPIFVALTFGKTPHEKAVIALKTCCISAGLILLFMVAGDKILDLMGISEPAFRIAGSLILLLSGLTMVMGRHSQKIKAESDQDVAVFPLSIPLIAGPGALTTGTVFFRQAENISVMSQLGVMGAVIVVMCIMYTVLRLSAPIAKYLGTLGSDVLTRVLGIILCSIAFQISLDAITGIVKSF